MRREAENIYTSFKSDRDRLWALISRDVRIIIVSGICAGAAGLSPALQSMIFQWLH